MILLKILLVAYFAAGFLYWAAQFYFVARTIRAVPNLADLPADGPQEWPKVSVVLPARNEGAAVETALLTRLAEDYPNLELIVVDDRSTDETGAIVDRIAARDPRAQAVHITDLPEGWIGKLNAMQQGAARATGEWLLFSDADVRVSPTALRRAIAYCHARGFDHLAAVPELLPTGFVLDTAISVFVRTICIAVRLWAIEDEKSKASAGAGAFNLVRRSVFEKIGGFERLKMEPADDVGLGQLLKASGARATAVNGRGAVSVYFYRTLWAAAVGAERAIFTAMGRFSMWRTIASGLLFLGLEMSPLALTFCWFWPGAAFLAATSALSATVARWADRPLLPSLFYPIGSLLMAIAIVRAGIVGGWRGGIYWRGTFYSTEALRKGHFFHF
jgi:cellulose synthase/poly-beta-1,6-N-acetylglucosamine synthase-like glycosyltransferase